MLQVEVAEALVHLAVEGSLAVVEAGDEGLNHTLHFLQDSVVELSLHGVDGFVVA